MKVCLLNDSFPPVIDGVVNVVMNYAEILQKEGLAQVVVGTPKYPDTDYSVYPYRVIPYQSFNTTKIVKGYRAGNPFDFSELREMAEFGPDVIHSHCPVASTIMARTLRHKTQAPLILTYHTKFDVDIARAVKAKFLQEEAIKVLASNIAACDEIWVVSQGAGENLKSLGYEGEYRVVSNGVDFAKGRVAEEEVRKATEGYDLPEGVPVFLFVGRMIKYKGLPLIVDALKILKEKGMDFRMVFVGSGPDAEEIKELSADLGKCIFTGPIYDRNLLRAWNTRADLFLFPSTYDTNGIVVREAAACGLASVLVEGSCAAEGITHGRNGFLIQETAESMAALLLEVGSRIDKLKEVGQTAMDEIYISWEDSVHLAHERYGEVIENKKLGMYPSRKEIREEIFRNHLEKIREDTKRAADIPIRFFDNMLDNAEQFGIEMRDGIRQDFKEYSEEAWKEFRKIWDEV